MEACLQGTDRIAVYHFTPKTKVSNIKKTVERNSRFFVDTLKANFFGMSITLKQYQKAVQAL